MRSKYCVALVTRYDLLLITKFGTIELFVLILDISAITHQLPCCYIMTTSKIGLYRLCLKLTCDYELPIMSNTKIGAAKDLGENYMKVRPPLVKHHSNKKIVIFFLRRLGSDLLNPKFGSQKSALL